MARTDAMFRDAFSITDLDSDTVDLPVRADGIYVGGAGDVKIRTEGNHDVTFVGLPVASLIPVSALRVFTTGTTATNLVAVTYQVAYDILEPLPSASVESEIVNRSGDTIVDRTGTEIWARA